MNDQSKARGPVVAKQQAGAIVIGRRPQDKRLDELVAKGTKDQTELLEEILLRQKRIEEHFGIK